MSDLLGWLPTFLLKLAAVVRNPVQHHQDTVPQSQWPPARRSQNLSMQPT